MYLKEVGGDGRNCDGRDMRYIKDTFWNFIFFFSTSHMQNIVVYDVNIFFFFGNTRTLRTEKC